MQRERVAAARVRACAGGECERRAAFGRAVANKKTVN
jgi:hypothetical protein